MEHAGISTKCRHCGHALHSAASIARGYSARCMKLARLDAIKAALDGFSDAQQAKALELLGDGGLIPTSRPGVYRAVSSDGTTTYLVHGAGVCNCPAGLHDRACYHVAAARAASAVLSLAA